MNYTNREGGCTRVHPYKLTANYLDKLSSRQVFHMLISTISKP
nr:MAG TPA: hypothetical protein [Bacteriophage sp.]